MDHSDLKGPVTDISSRVSILLFICMFTCWLCKASLNSFLFLFQLQYKYQINIDGTVAAYRLPYLLAGDSVVLKQDSGYYEHFYNELRPWEHYIPIRADLGDLLEKIQWARDHDEEVTDDDYGLWIITFWCDFFSVDPYWPCSCLCSCGFNR